MHKLRAIAILFLVYGLTVSLAAQMSSKSAQTRREATTPSISLAPLSPSFEPETECRHFQTIGYATVKAQKKDYQADALKNLDSCSAAMNDNIPDPKDTDALATLKARYRLITTDDIDEQLITSHYLNRVMRRWAGLYRTELGADYQKILDRIDMIEQHLQGFMSSEGLAEPFAGSLVAGPVIGETGKQAAGTTAAAINPGSGTATATTGTAASSSTSQTNALAHIEWASRHFGDESFSPVDFSFGGAFGLQPALTLLTNPPAPAAGTSSPGAGTPTQTASTANVTSQYQSAFVWDLKAKGNLHTGSNAEATAYARGGQIRLLNGNGATIVDQGANSTLQIPLNANADKMSWFWEGGAEFRYYKKQLEIVHAEKSQLDPAFEFGVGFRKDSRFNQSNGTVGFNSPDKRLVFHFMVNAIRILDRRPDTTGSKAFTVSFGIEHERGFGANPVPSGTQIVLRGDIDLLKAINPGSNQ